MDRGRGDRKSRILSWQVNQGGRMVRGIGSIQESHLMLNSQLRWGLKSLHRTEPLVAWQIQGQKTWRRAEGRWRGWALSMVDAPRSLGLKGRRERIVSEGGVWSQWSLRMGRMFYNKWLFQSQLRIPRIFTSIIFIKITNFYFLGWLLKGAILQQAMLSMS